MSLSRQPVNRIFAIQRPRWQSSPLKEWSFVFCQVTSRVDIYQPWHRQGLYQGKSNLGGCECLKVIAPWLTSNKPLKIRPSKTHSANSEIWTAFYGMLHLLWRFNKWFKNICRCSKSIRSGIFFLSALVFCALLLALGCRYSYLTFLCRKSSKGKKWEDL